MLDSHSELTAITRRVSVTLRLIRSELWWKDRRCFMNNKDILAICGRQERGHPDLMPATAAPAGAAADASVLFSHISRGI